MKQLHPKTVNFALAALSYDEKKFPDYIPFICGEDVKFHFDLHKNGAYYHGVVLNEKTGLITSVFRGTDGDNFAGSLKAWITNFNLFTGPDGIHNGAQEVVADFLKKYWPYFEGSARSSSVGHSQGSMCGKINALLIAERFKNIDVSTFETYADFPSGDKRFSDRCEIQEDAGRLFGIRETVRGDPAESDRLRNSGNPLLDGVDIGTRPTLPDILGPHASSPLGLFAHSPRAICLAKMWEEIRKLEISVKIDEYYLESLSWILWKTVN